MISNRNLLLQKGPVPDTLFRCKTPCSSLRYLWWIRLRIVGKKLALMMSFSYVLMYRVLKLIYRWFQEEIETSSTLTSCTLVPGTHPTKTLVPLCLRNPYHTKQRNKKTWKTCCSTPNRKYQNILDTPKAPNTQTSHAPPPRFFKNTASSLHGLTFPHLKDLHSNWWATKWLDWQSLEPREKSMKVPTNANAMGSTLHPPGWWLVIRFL